MTMLDGAIAEISTTPPLNRAIITDLIKWAEQDREWLALHPGAGSWDQGNWGAAGNEAGANGFVARVGEFAGEINFCKTSYCMAGGAAVEGGYRMLLGKNVYGTDYSAEFCVRVERTGEFNAMGAPLYRDAPGARAESIREVGKRVLGLTEDEAYHLFDDSENTIEYLKARFNGCAKERMQPPLFDGSSTDEGYDEWNEDEDEDEEG